MKQMVKNKPNRSQKFFSDGLNKCISSINRAVHSHPLIIVTLMVGAIIKTPDTSTSVPKNILQTGISAKRAPIWWGGRTKQSTNRLHN